MRLTASNSPGSRRGRRGGRWHRSGSDIWRRDEGPATEHGAAGVLDAFVFVFVEELGGQMRQDPAGTVPWKRTGSGRPAPASRQAVVILAVAELRMAGMRASVRMARGFLRFAEGVGVEDGGGAFFEAVLTKLRMSPETSVMVGKTNCGFPKVVSMMRVSAWRKTGSSAVRPRRALKSPV